MTDQEIIALADSMLETGCQRQRMGWGLGYRPDESGGCNLANLPRALFPFARLLEKAVVAECIKLCKEDAFVDQWKGLAEAQARIRNAFGVTNE